MPSVSSALTYLTPLPPLSHHSVCVCVCVVCVCVWCVCVCVWCVCVCGVCVVCVWCVCVVCGVCVCASFSNHNTGSRGERFRLHNPFKVPCYVNIDIRTQDHALLKHVASDSKEKGANKAGGAKGTTGSSLSGSEDIKDKDKENTGFRAEPRVLMIPGREHRYVMVHFEPKSLQVYQAVFEATVEKGKTNTRSTLFELRCLREKERKRER